MLQVTWWYEDKGQWILLGILSCILAVEATFPSAWSLPILLKSAADVTQDKTLWLVVEAQGWFLGMIQPTLSSYWCCCDAAKFLSLPLSSRWSYCFTLQLKVWNGYSGPPWRPSDTIIVSQLGCSSSFSHQHHTLRNSNLPSTTVCILYS